MKSATKHPLCVYLSMGTGALAFSLRLWLQHSGVDSRGLFRENHVANTLLIGLSALFCIYLIFVCLCEKKGSLLRQSGHQAPSLLGCAFGAAGFLFLGLTFPWVQGGGLGNVARIFCLLCAAAFALIYLLGFWGKKRPFWLFVIPVIFFMLLPLVRHGQWSRQTQFSDYGYPLLASASLLLYSYRYCSLQVQPESRRWVLLTGLAAVYLCILSAAAEYAPFYLAMALWVSGSLMPLCKPKEATPMELPPQIEACLSKLEESGKPGYLVGGCVRDHLLGIAPHDYDLCSAATPEEICQLFADHTLVRSGEKHGTIGVVFEKDVVEITTFRTEGAYSDSRHPDWVEFVPNLEEDLGRRDFTVNAIAYNPKLGYQDPFGGMADLQDGILRAVGAPTVRFTEDALRILRGVRFAVRFGFTVERRTLQAMFALKDNMENLAQERVFSELCKLIPLLRAQDMITFAPILTKVLPELAPCVDFQQHSPHHAYDVYTHTAHVVAGVSADLALRLAALFHDTGKPVVFQLDENGRGHFYNHAQESAALADAALQRLKAPTALREEVVFLVKHHMDLWENQKNQLCRRLGKYGVQTCQKLLDLQESDFSSKGVTATSEIDFAAIRNTIAEILKEKACLHISDLAIGGKELIAAGFTPGPQMGAYLEQLLQDVIDGKVENDAASLLAQIKTYK